MVIKLDSFMGSAGIYYSLAFDKSIENSLERWMPHGGFK